MYVNGWRQMKKMKDLLCCFVFSFGEWFFLICLCNKLRDIKGAVKRSVAFIYIFKIVPFFVLFFGY